MSQPWPNVAATTATGTTVPAVAASTTVLPADSSRVKFVIVNPMGASPPAAADRIFIKLGLGCTPVDWTYFLESGGTYESYVGEYTGPVSVCLNSPGPRDIRVTEEK